ncbi:MAG: YraN family protein [Propionibacteriaceae bacterium]|nr:YraN family protein [Propionibacteriaceae bacterium]
MRTQERRAHRTLGARGEDLAVDHLLSQGWVVIERNWRCRTGEIDIVAADPEGTVVFVEVKCRAGTGYGDPLEAITYAKARRLRQLAGLWLAEHGEGAPQVRLDAIGVIVARGQRPRIHHVKGIGS